MELGGRKAVIIPFFGGSTIIGVTGSLFGSEGSTVYLVQRFAFTANTNDLIGWTHGTDSSAGSGYGMTGLQYNEFPRLSWGKNDHGSGMRIPQNPFFEWFLQSYHVRRENASTLRTQLTQNDQLQYDYTQNGTCVVGTHWCYHTNAYAGSYEFASNIIFPRYIAPGSSDDTAVKRYLKLLYPMLGFPFPS
jgi:hypothetical protein